jgi:Fur family transcriptional regulator, ferric uptake regulator
MDSKDLKEAGLKVTAPRLRILQILHSKNKRHFSAEDIYRKLVKQNSKIGLATVYRVLAQFEACGLVSRLQLYKEQAVFEVGDKDDHHDHMVCIKCGKIVEFYDDTIEKRQTQIAQKHGLKLQDHHMVLFCECVHGCEKSK